MKSENKKEIWWLCDNDLCEKRLGKITEGDLLDVSQVEILGAHGEQFIINPTYIRVFCKSCGQENSLIGGPVASKKWMANWKKLNASLGPLEHDEFDSDSFYINPFKRNLLLQELTGEQKRVFRYLQDNWWSEDEDAVKALGFKKRQDYIELIKGIYEAEHKVSEELMKKELKQREDDTKKWRKQYEERKNRLQKPK